MSKVYYNEIDPFAAAWLRELVKAGHVADGDVDTRSIEDVTSADLRGYTQCHFFAGIGGWSYALRLAGWSDDRAVWTGSCPCQPFSAAGKGAGFADERHLWPAWLHLIRECKPRVVFGEQVANNLAWLDLVQTDLEGEGYASGAVIIGAHSVGAPHIRQRLYWMADAVGERRKEQHPLQRQERGDIPEAAGRGALGNVVNPNDPRPQGWVEHRDGTDERSAGAASVVGGLGDTDEQRHDGSRACSARRIKSADSGHAGGLGDTELHGYDSSEPREMDRGADASAAFGGGQRMLESQGSNTPNPWIGAELIACTDGKARPIEPSIFPLADGVSARVGVLRGAGNAIVPQAAAAFIGAYLKL